MSLLIMEQRGGVEPVMEASPEKEFEVFKPRQMTREELYNAVRSQSSLKMSNHNERRQKAGDKIHVAYLFASPIVFTDYDSDLKR